MQRVHNPAARVTAQASTVGGAGARRCRARCRFQQHAQCTHKPRVRNDASCPAHLLTRLLLRKCTPWTLAEHVRMWCARGAHDWRRAAKSTSGGAGNDGGGRAHRKLFLAPPPRFGARSPDNGCTAGSARLHGQTSSGRGSRTLKPRPFRSRPIHDALDLSANRPSNFCDASFR
jgi:hypothetical protein